MARFWVRLLAPAACNLHAPSREELKLTHPSAWRYIGKDASLYDLEDICPGKATYGIDARIDGMVYASIEHPPVVTVRSGPQGDTQTWRK